MIVLCLNHVARQFGDLRVIDDLSFSVAEGSIFGFIGRNGAGKTTTMKMILGLLKPDRGEIEVCGEDVTYGETKTNRFIGYLPDVPEFYGYMTPREYLRLCGEITGMSAAAIKAKSTELLGIVGLGEANRKIRGFSRGMKQRLGIAQALLNEPRVLICDEPTSALDPIGRKEILDILSVVSGRTTVIFSTHILADVERICDHIGVLDHGRLVLQGNLAEIKNSYRQDAVSVELDLRGQALAALAAKVKALPFVSGVDSNGHALVAHFGDLAANGGQLLAFLGGEAVTVLKYEVLEPTLEHLFLEAVR